MLVLYSVAFECYVLIGRLVTGKADENEFKEGAVTWRTSWMGSSTHLFVEDSSSSWRSSTRQRSLDLLHFITYNNLRFHPPLSRSQEPCSTLESISLMLLLPSLSLSLSRYSCSLTILECLKIAFPIAAIHPLVSFSELEKRECVSPVVKISNEFFFFVLRSEGCDLDIMPQSSRDHGRDGREQRERESVRGRCGMSNVTLTEWQSTRSMTPCGAAVADYSMRGWKVFRRRSQGWREGGSDNGRDGREQILSNKII